MLWTDCLNRLRQELSGNVFTMWIRPLVAEEVEDTLKLYAPNPIGRVTFKNIIWN